MVGSHDPITRQLRDVHRRFAGLNDGTVATYIPELATADPGQFGIALASLEGRVYQAGDAQAQFTIQSVSKPFVYAMVLAELGIDAVLRRVGVEPSGEAFNAISLERETGRPANPMINAGAILATSLVRAASPEIRFERIRATLSDFAGRRLEVDDAVYRSELQTGHRNRALAYLMLNTGSLRADVEETINVYFRQCSLLVSAVDIAIMSATLANRGVNPVTGKSVVDSDTASHVLTVMATCGMYDSSGEWLVRVGLPAKSGVSGAVVAASPGEFGIGLFSPLLDDRGNSVRSIAACQELATRFELQLLRRPGQPAPAMYLVDLAEFARGWTGWSEGQPADPKALDNLVLRGLQGDLCFADVERLMHSLDPWLDPTSQIREQRIVLDLHRVGSLSGAAAALMSALVGDLVRAGLAVVAIDQPDRQLVPELVVCPSLVGAVETLASERQRADPPPGPLATSSIGVE